MYRIFRTLQQELVTLALLIVLRALMPQPAIIAWVLIYVLEEYVHLLVIQGILPTLPTEPAILVFQIAKVVLTRQLAMPAPIQIYFSLGHRVWLPVQRSTLQIQQLELVIPALLTATSV
mmetsp:Transcript_58829/g.67987  ORF Transcript_58829/g.67987 Transcript_58829/m.67987 type:complete len:119 (-) Transcript_58829:2195-2551(-)